MVLSDDPRNILTVDDLPMGVLKDANKQAATQIVEIFKEKAAGMPSEVRDKILSLLKEGAFHHTKSSGTEPSYHPLAESMWDKQVKEPWWYNITYENWFILVGIYGLEKLGSSTIGAGIKQAMEQRYGGNIGTDLTWRNHPVDHGHHARHLLTQVVAKVVEQENTITEQQKTITELKKAVNELQKHVRQQQGPTGRNQGAAQTAEDDDELMEIWAAYCEEDDDEEILFPYE